MVDPDRPIGDRLQMTLTIRVATSGDTDSIIGLDSNLPHGSPRADALRGWVAAGHAYIATDDGEPRGYAVMTRHFFDRAFVELLMVGAKFRRQGIATAMLRHLASVSPTPMIWTSTNESNAPMRALLAAEGFIPSGAVEGLDEGDPELFFRKRVR
jgi:GNAT superfamily N-acetyltransferase